MTCELEYLHSFLKTSREYGCPQHGSRTRPPQLSLDRGPRGTQGHTGVPAGPGTWPPSAFATTLLSGVLAPLWVLAAWTPERRAGPVPRHPSSVPKAPPLRKSLSQTPPAPSLTSATPLPGVAFAETPRTPASSFPLRPASPSLLNIFRICLFHPVCSLSSSGNSAPFGEGTVSVSNAAFLQCSEQFLTHATQ